MSLSNPGQSRLDGLPEPPEATDQPKTWGTIFMGPGPMGETTLAGVSGAQTGGWDSATEALYLERVREKATALAREILEKAAIEAENLRAKAQAQGHEEGLAQAQQELNEFRAGMGDSVAAVLEAIQAQTGPVLLEWKEDLTSVLRLAVERVVGLTLAQERAAVLESLYLDAVQRLDDQRRLVIRVNPEDEAAVADIILSAKERTPNLGTWSVKADPSLEPGGLRIESERSMADNSLAARRKAVEEIVAGLEIP